MSIFYSEIDFVSTNDNQLAENYLLEYSFDNEENNSMENILRKDLDNTNRFCFTNSELFDPNLGKIQYNESNIQNIVIPEVQIPHNYFIIEPKSLETEKPKLGRKSKNSNDKGKHDKYKQDNMIRKLKALLKRVFLDFINLKLKEMNILSEFKINRKTYKNEEIRLLNIKQDDVKDISCEKNRQILQNTIRQMFSVERSGNYSNYPVDFNIQLIKRLDEIDNGKKITSIFDMSYLECLRYIRKDPKIIYDHKYSCLKGMEKIFDETLKRKLSKNCDERYYNDFIDLIKNFETIYYNKKERARRI